MANLDTQSKRASSVNILKPYQLALVLPDGTIAKADRQHTAWSYSGIDVDGPSTSFPALPALLLAAGVAFTASLSIGVDVDVALPIGLSTP